ncbi:hypothetical protein Bca4012_096683 [Brassica carinata]
MPLKKRVVGELVKFWISAVRFPPEPTTTSDLNFIRTSCNTTLYPDVCFTSLAFYASAVQNNPARLANGVSLSCAKYRAAYLSNFLASQPQPQLPSTTASPTSETRAVEQMCASLRQPREMNHRRME